MKDTLTAPKPMVAVVDDDPAVCNSLKFSLEIEGFSVRLFFDAEEILREPNLLEYSCFIIDYNMPTMNGLELLRKLREQRVQTPAVFITGKADATIRERAAAIDIPLIEKPFIGNILLDTIQSAMAKGG
ncbi:MAG: response regulator [Rhizobiales bacterium]|nr:response regulator [Hyphomicrobiales bacterium]